jgi:hypothetical protein
MQGRHGHLTAEQKQLAFRLRAQDWRLVDIAREIGCTAPMVGLMVRDGKHGHGQPFGWQPRRSPRVARGSRAVPAGSAPSRPPSLASSLVAFIATNRPATIVDSKRSGGTAFRHAERPSDPVRGLVVLRGLFFRYALTRTWSAHDADMVCDRGRPPPLRRRRGERHSRHRWLSVRRCPVGTDGDDLRTACPHLFQADYGVRTHHVRRAVPRP